MKLGFLLVALVSCGRPRLEPLPHPTASPEPVPQEARGLRAGLGRSDITPPPGVGLMGYGPEGREARGYRHRLYARALVLEDADGERIAFVAVDLPAVSMLLHRQVAHDVVGETGIGADRLVLAATHTHSGPGHFFESRAYNALGSSVAGFDREVVSFLADRIASAVREATAGLREARVVWGEAAVWAFTRNRSLEAFERNPLEWMNRFPKPAVLPPVEGRVDSTFAMLRIDLADSGGAYRPAGALSIFAMHGTGNPMANDLLDGDLHAIVERRVERHIDSLNGRPRSFHPAAVHLVMNGASGDVSPDLTWFSRCKVPALARVRRPGGPRSPPGPELWIPPPAAQEADCLQSARVELNDFADGLSDAAVDLFGSLDALTDQVSVRRAFRAVTLTDSAQAAGLCAPRPGTARVGGAEDGSTRYLHWRLLGLINVGFEEGGAAARTPAGCHGAKHQFLGGLRKPLLRSLPLPETAQLIVVRVGLAVLGALPFEATTVAGGMIRRAMDSAVAPRDSTARRVFLIGLANGYNQYVTSPAEYEAQHYEGGSTLYGPRTAERLAALMAGLAAALPSGRAPSPPADVPQAYGRPGADRDIMPRATAGPAPRDITRRVSTGWEGDVLVIRWNDVHPGRLVPADGPVLRIDQQTGTGWAPLVWDDDRSVEVRAVGPAGAQGYRWEARWSPDPAPSGAMRVVLMARAGLAELVASVPPR